MKKLRKITLQNFKFFYDNVSIDFERKNILLYGENGSGKSSLYWSLYTFLQSVFKVDDAEIRKYFDIRHDENLINRYADDNAVSSIAVTFEEENGTSPETREISLASITTKTDKLVEETTLASDFIDHKVLSRIYAYYHKEEIDLFNFFQHELFSFINFRIELNGSKNADKWWSQLKSGITPRPKMHDQIYKDFQANLTKFNEELKYYLTNIQQLTNEHLEKRFSEKFRIKLVYRSAIYNDFKTGSKGRSWKMKSPQIILSVELLTPLITNADKKIIDSPQSFLNEAKLSTIALAMRFAILDEKFVSAYPKILVLDDMLMSMDMSNREFVLAILLENYLPDYQILFFTHQRGLFEDARMFIQNHYAEKARLAGESDRQKQDKAWEKDWKLFEMYETESGNGVPIPHISEYESSIQKAYKYFKYQVDYNACGNNLRVALEEFFLDFIPTKFQKNGNMIAGILVDARTYFSYVGFDTSLIEKLERYRERSLNPSSHYNPRTDFFKRELEDIFLILEKLKQNRNEALLEKDSKIKFEIRTQGGKVFSYTAILLDNICLYQKYDKSSSFFVDADERAYVMIGCTIDNTTTNLLNHEINRCSLQTLYTNTVTYINQSDVAIVQTDMSKVFTDESGKTLEQLKHY